MRDDHVESGGAGAVGRIRPYSLSGVSTQTAADGKRFHILPAIVIEGAGKRPLTVTADAHSRRVRLCSQAAHLGYVGRHPGQQRWHFHGNASLRLCA